MKNECEIREVIRQRKARYCRLIDTKRWGELAELLSPSLEAVFVDPDGSVTASFHAANELISSAASFLGEAKTIHQVHNSEMAFGSDAEVTAIWSMEDYLVFPAIEGKPSTSMRGYGHYHDTWKRSDDDWLISRLELRRTILEWH